MPHGPHHLSYTSGLAKASQLLKEPKGQGITECGTMCFYAKTIWLNVSFVNLLECLNG